MATTKAEKKDGLWENVKTIFWALVIAGVFRTLLFQPFFIPSASMKPTLLIGDFLFVNKFSYGYSEDSCPFSMCKFIDGRWMGRAPKRGDVIVFRHPVDGTDYIKRLVGLPGDRVQMRQGVLYINGEEAPQTPEGIFTETYERQGGARNYPSCANGAVGEGGTCEKELLLETLPGDPEPHYILNIADDRPLDTTPVYTVPEGHFFFVGDNRDNSTDGRVPRAAGGIGFVPYENLLGRVDRVIFSAEGRSLLFFWTWRLDRFFVPVR